MQPTLVRAIGGGVIGTLAMTAVGLFVAPMMGMPPMNPAEMLAAQMGGMIAAGWLAHFMIGILLAVGYVRFFATRLPGSPVLRGAAYGVLPWLMAQLLVMPMMGMPIFSGSMAMATGSLLGHLVYGAIVGGVAGTPHPANRLSHA